MTDIVERLRKESARDDHRGAGLILRQAADEIDRLRKAETAADNAALIAAIPKMVEALKAYEQWEADIIMERKCWDGPMPVQLTRDLYNRMIEIQDMRNAVLASIGRTL